MVCGAPGSSYCSVQVPASGFRLRARSAGAILGAAPHERPTAPQGPGGGRGDGWSLSRPEEASHDHRFRVESSIRKAVDDGGWVKLLQLPSHFRCWGSP